ncbi:Protein of unknown function [Natronoarchaeum philippinense]|uniref:Uncharacterized protein n=1 Tax=Natronoarchaeum philippinense TaxID=558529 RepID=A0A285P8U9_NATPI|nr:DUF4054 domain-containing protein [Natronoarchaeum philippinense]SNZ18165.1 Protein of unknown function [Natronoarchaeum philippinense]
MAVQPDDVADALGSTDLADSQLQALIDAAGRMYDRRIEGKTVDAEARDDVVTQLAAHLVASGPERQVSSAGEGGGNVSFEGETGEGLSGTTYGQTAVLLDPTGSLAGADKPSASIDVPNAKGLDR